MGNSVGLLSPVSSLCDKTQSLIGGENEECATLLICELWPQHKSGFLDLAQLEVQNGDLYSGMSPTSGTLKF